MRWADVLLLGTISAILLIAADPSWKAKLPAQWSEEDARQLLTASPWVKEVRAGIARRETEDQLREGGRMGQPRGVGYDGVDPKGSGPKLPTNVTDFLTGAGGDDRSPRSMAQTVTLKLRWETALPVRLAELKSHELEPPTLEGDGYRIAVYGVPGGNFKGDPKQLGDPLRKTAFLKREGKKDVSPSSVEVFQGNNGLTVVYLFPLSAEISRKDRQLIFEAHIGRVVVVQPFDLAEMEFQGRLEL
jgi:hypothetical protein